MGDAYRFGPPAVRRWRSQQWFLGQRCFVNSQRQPCKSLTANAHLAPGYSPARPEARGLAPALDGHTHRACWRCVAKDFGWAFLLCHPHGWKFLRQPALSRPQSASAARRASATGQRTREKMPLGRAVSGCQILAVRRCSVAELWPSIGIRFGPPTTLTPMTTKPSPSDKAQGL